MNDGREILEEVATLPFYDEREVDDFVKLLLLARLKDRCIVEVVN